MEQSYVIRNDRVIGKAVPNINYNYSTCPIGSIFAFSSERIPLGFLICDGASYKVAEYPDLYTVIGNTYGGDTENFNVPDYRETVLVGAGENTTDTIKTHDVYELGQFKDDQFQDHSHSVYAATPGHTLAYDGINKYLTTTSSTGSANTGRTGTTTHGKQKGVVYIIKAFHTNEGADSGVSDDVVEYVDNKVASELKTSSNTDVTLVTLTDNSTFKTMGDTYCKYQVKNGICYFQFFVEAIVATDTFAEIYNGLPKPTFSQYFAYPVYYNSQGLNKTLQVNISENGLLTAANTLQNTSYMIAGSYPIA